MKTYMALKSEIARLEKQAEALRNATIPVAKAGSAYERR